MGRILIERSTSYDPASLRVLEQAFDKAWEAIRSRYHQAQVIQAKREQLATAILNLASVGERDPEVLVVGALLDIDNSERPTDLSAHTPPK